MCSDAWCGSVSLGNACKFGKACRAWGPFSWASCILLQGRSANSSASAFQGPSAAHWKWRSLWVLDAHGNGPGGKLHFWEGHKYFKWLIYVQVDIRRPYWFSVTLFACKKEMQTPVPYNSPIKCSGAHTFTGTADALGLERCTKAAQERFGRLW